MTGTYKQFTGAAPVGFLTAPITGSPASFTASPYAGFPTGSGSVPFMVCVARGTATEEKILCSAMGSGVFTIQTRGFDGTTQQNQATGATVEHTWDADSANDSQQHIHETTRDDHTQYAKADGSRAITGAQTFDDGITVTGAITGSSTVAGTALTATLTGTNGRYVGSTDGAPASGTFSTGDFANDPTNDCFWICTAGGTPGTWVQVGGPTDAAWTTPTLSNSWIPYITAYFSPGYRRANGRIYLRGAMQLGTVGQPAFVLPAGYRPSKALNFGVWCMESPNTGSMVVEIDGSVVPNVTTGAIFLDGIDFDVL